MPIANYRSPDARDALAPEREAEIVEELSLHLDERYRELCGTEAPDAARALALADLGDAAALSRRLATLRQASAARGLPPPAGAPRQRLAADLWRSRSPHRAAPARRAMRVDPVVALRNE